MKKTPLPKRLLLKPKKLLVMHNKKVKVHLIKCRNLPLVTNQKVRKNFPKWKKWK